MSTQPTDSTPAPGRYAWVRKGDVNAFFGLMLDNIGDMILMASLLVLGFGFPRGFVLERMIPGTALAVLVGDLIYTVLAFRLARRSGRSDVTAMPLGLDTPSTFGVVFLILGPAFTAARGRGLSPEEAAHHAWMLGIAMIAASGLLKLVAAPLAGLIRRQVPRAGLLGSLAAIALVLISFLPLREIVDQPVPGLISLAVILATLTARWELPGRIPGALGAVIVGCLVYYGQSLVGLGPGFEGPPPSWRFRGLPFPVAEWLAWLANGENWREAAGYLPVAVPLALATIVGGIDCTESASAAGDEYPTGQVLGADGLATLVGGLFGGVIQSTAYIGHPAYKAMGARAGYTVATAVFVGLAGVLGYFEGFFALIPRAVIFPILIFVGLEIGAHSFAATPRRHYPALALACIPALAYLVRVHLDQVVDPARPFATLPAETRHLVQTILMLSGGFLVTGLLWATVLARWIDGRGWSASVVLLLAGACALFGVIHSPLPSSPITSPAEVLRRVEEQGRSEATAGRTPYHWAAAYVGMAGVAIGLVLGGRAPRSEPDPEASV